MSDSGHTLEEVDAVAYTQGPGLAGALLVGVVLMFVWYLFPRSKPFFSGRSLNRSTPVMVPDEPGDFVRSIDGGI